MVRHVVATSIRWRFLVALIAVSAIVFGVVQLRGAPVEPLPEFAPVTVEVQSEAPGLSAQEVEDLVTMPLEANLLSGVAWVESMRSASVPGLSSVVMTFEPGTDLVRARQVVQERLTQGALLTNASRAPVMLQPTSASNRVTMIGLSSKDTSLMDLSVLARWTIRPKLMSIPGVANVAIWGQRERQLQVLADPVRMKDKGVTLDQVVATTGNSLWVSPLSFLNASTPGRGGFVDLPQQRVSIQHVSPITGPDQLAKVAVEGKPGVILGDVATVVENNPVIIGDGLVNDESGLVMVVEKQPGASAAVVSKGIEKAVKSLSTGLPGVDLDTSLYRPAAYAAESKSNLRIALVVALLLVAIGSFVSFLSWRAMVVTLTGVIASLLGGWFVLRYRTAPINLLALTGLGIGVVVAIADASSGASRAAAAARESGDSLFKRLHAALSAAATPAVYTALAAGMLAVPIYLLEGRAGAFLPEIVLGYLVVVVASLLSALLVVPAVAAIVYGIGHPGSVSPSTRAIAAVSGRLAAVATRPVIPVTALVVGIGACLGLYAALDRSTRPVFEEQTVVVSAVGTAGASPQAMTKALTEVATSIRGLGGVANVSGHVGRAIQGERVGGANMGELWITMKDGADRASTVGAIRRVASDYAGLQTQVGPTSTGAPMRSSPTPPRR